MARKSKSAKRGSYKERWAREAEEFRAELERNIRNFEASVLTAFSFLETEYGFQRRAAERRDFEDLRDASFIVPYYGLTVAVQVAYGVASSRVDVEIYELENGRMPERVSFWGHTGYARAIDADSYIAMVSGGTVPPVLPEPSPRKPRIGIFQAGDLRREVLRTNMAGVVAQVAERVKSWCVPVLRGDTSTFPAVQQLHKQRHSAKD